MQNCPFPDVTSKCTLGVLLINLRHRVYQLYHHHHGNVNSQKRRFYRGMTVWHFVGSVPRTMSRIFLSFMELLGVPAACRESFRAFTFERCLMTQPAGQYTYCQSKAPYSWSVLRKISPYNLKGRPVESTILLSRMKMSF